MEKFENDKMFKKILANIKEADDLNPLYKKLLIKDLYRIIKAHFPHIQFSDSLGDFLILYAENVLRFTESVIERDFNHPEIKKEEEVARMNEVVNKLHDFEGDKEFSNSIQTQVKKCIINFYPDIYNLSGNGFRLLDLNTKFLNKGFIANFYSLEEID